MKFLCLVYSFLFAYSSLAQQYSIMQPAIANSDKKLDSVNILCLDIVKKNTNSEQKTEKWIVKQYDSDKNPTELMTYYYGFEGGSSIPIDSIKVFLEHHPYEQCVPIGNTLFGSTKDWIYPTAYGGIYNLFNLKSVTEEIYNPISSEWIPLYYTKGLLDHRLPIIGNSDISRTEYFYDEDFNITYIYKKEGIEDGNGYLTEQIYYEWDNQNGLIPDYKYVFYNTYNENNELIETIRTKIDDISSGVEINISKHSFTYSSTLFESIYQSWNDTANDWDAPSNKWAIEYNTSGNPIVSSSYSWYNDQWNLNNETITNYNASGLYSGYSYPMPPFGSVDYSLLYNFENLVVSEIYNEVIMPPPNAGGYVEAKAFFYDPPLGVTNHEIIKGPTIYPNPVSKVLYIKNNYLLNYNIYSIHGSIVKKGTVTNQISVEDLKEGIYFLELLSNTSKSVNMFIVE